MSGFKGVAPPSPNAIGYPLLSLTYVRTGILVIYPSIPQQD